MTRHSNRNMPQISAKSLKVAKEAAKQCHWHGAEIRLITPMASLPQLCPACCYQAVSVCRESPSVSESHSMSRWLPRPTPPRQLRTNTGFVGFVIRSNLVSTWSILQSLQSKGSGASITSSSEYLTSQLRCCSRVESSSHSSFSFDLISLISLFYLEALSAYLLRRKDGA